MKKCDILFLQETWLFNFQLPLLGEYSSSHVSFGKSVDDDNPLPPTQKPRDMEVWLVLSIRIWA